jgi:hypothetical protein
MGTFNIIKYLGFELLVSVSNTKKISDDQEIIKEQVKELDFGVDYIYFYSDQDKSYPAIFFKRVDSFDSDTLAKIYDIHRKIWNYKKIFFLYVYSDAEIRIYNCTQKPVVKSKQTDYQKEIHNLEIESASFSDQEKLKRLNNIFSRMAIDTGVVWTIEDASDIQKKITLRTRVDKYLVESLINTKMELQNQGLEDANLIHKIMLRSLFLLYLEDRKATDAVFYNNIRKNAQSYFDILENVSDTYALYRKLEDHFNGSLFTIENNEEEIINKNHLQLIKKCFISGYDGTNQMELFPNWRIFDFSIIQI